MTFVLVPLVCLTASLALRVEPPRVLFGSTPSGVTLARCAASAALLVGAVGGAIVAHRVWASRQVLCCDVSGTVDPLLAQASELRAATGLPVVSVANPDLGLVSLPKRVNVTDLGELGDPLLARVRQRAGESGQPEVTVEYLNHFATPDVVELHGAWSCAYTDWWKSEDFRARYQKVRDDGWTAAWGRVNCAVPVLGHMVVPVRDPRGLPQPAGVRRRGTLGRRQGRVPGLAVRPL